MQISLVVVNYHSSNQLRQMLESIVGVNEVIVVDHSEDEAELAVLRTLGVDRIIAQKNLGYGAGLNRGAREAAGEVLVLANPDLRFLDGAFGLLTEALERPEVGVAAPALFWDESARWSIPHARHVTWWTELEAARFPRLARRRYLKRQLGLWSTGRTVQTPVVSGTVMALKRSTFVAAGGFDERYFLFYEENDFCMRLGQLGLQPVVVPAAKVQHAVGVSASARGAEHLDASYLRYRQLWFPAWFTMVRPHPISAPAPAVRIATREQRKGAGRWVIAPNETFMPVVLGPPVEELDADTPDFMPLDTPPDWRRGILDGATIRMVE